MKKRKTKKQKTLFRAFDKACRIPPGGPNTLTLKEFLVLVEYLYKKR